MAEGRKVLRNERETAWRIKPHCELAYLTDKWDCEDIQKMKKIIISLLIVVFVTIFFIVKLINGIQLNGFVMEKDIILKTNNCEFIHHEVGKNNIVIRIDDIQGNYNRDLQVKMLEDLKKKGLTASLAVIPLNLMEDELMVNYLYQNKCNFEIGLHGYDNNDYEFATLNYQQAKEKLEKGLKILNRIEEDVFTFIPPNNEFSDEAEQAVYDSDIEIISAGHWNSKYGFSISSYDWLNHEIRDAQEVLDECQEDLDRYEICIIMVHPQDYTTNGQVDLTHYNEYLELLSGIKLMDANVVTFRDLYEDEQAKEIIFAR